MSGEQERLWAAQNAMNGRLTQTMAYTVMYRPMTRDELRQSGAFTWRGVPLPRWLWVRIFGTPMVRCDDVSSAPVRAPLEDS